MVFCYKAEGSHHTTFDTIAAQTGCHILLLLLCTFQMLPLLLPL
jgi:hypothetical protein